jgi:hypothetical protein
MCLALGWAHHDSVVGKIGDYHRRQLCKREEELSGMQWERKFAETEGWPTASYGMQAIAAGLVFFLIELTSLAVAVWNGDPLVALFWCVPPTVFTVWLIWRIAKYRINRLKASCADRE